MTEQELNTIVQAVIAALKTSGKTISQLTTISTIDDEDMFEVGGGRKVSFGVLNETIVGNAEDAMETSLEQKADITAIGTLKQLALSQLPSIYLYNVEAIASCSVVGAVWFKTDGSLYFHGENGDVLLGEPADVLYVCDGVIYQWDGDDDEFVEVASGGGLSPEDIINSTTSTAADKALAAAQGYVLRREMEKILAALSNSAFSTARPVLSWGAPVTYSITQTLTNCTSSHTGNTIDGRNPVNIELTPNMGKIINPTEVEVTVAGGGAYTVTRNSSTGKVTVSIPVVTGAVTIVATGRYAQGYLVTKTLSNCSSSNSGTTAYELSKFETVLTADSGYTMNGVTPVVTMGGETLTGVWNASNGKITIPEVTGDITITATAAESLNPSVTLNLTGCAVVGTTPTEVESGEDLELTLRKDSSWWDSSEALLGRDIIVFMGDAALERGTGFTAVNQQNGDIVVTVGNVTANVMVMNVVWKPGYPVTTGSSVASSDRSKYNDTIIPIPDGCTELRIYNTYPGNGSSRGVRFYDENGDDVAAAAIAVNADGNNGTYPGEMIATWDASAAASHKFVRFGIYTFTNGFTDKYIKYKDSNNNLKYIWKGQ